MAAEIAYLISFQVTIMIQEGMMTTMVEAEAEVVETIPVQ